MIIGSKLATQSDESYFRAIQYMKRSEELQSKVIQNNKKEGEMNYTQDEMNTKMTED